MIEHFIKRHFVFNTLHVDWLLKLNVRATNGHTFTGSTDRCQHHQMRSLHSKVLSTLFKCVCPMEDVCINDPTLQFNRGLFHPLLCLCLGTDSKCFFDPIP